MLQSWPKHCPSQLQLNSIQIDTTVEAIEGVESWSNYGEPAWFSHVFNAGNNGMGSDDALSMLGVYLPESCTLQHLKVHLLSWKYFTLPSLAWDGRFRMFASLQELTLDFAGYKEFVMRLGIGMVEATRLTGETQPNLLIA
jgi:hypothetical protein